MSEKAATVHVRIRTFGDPKGIEVVQKSNEALDASLQKSAASAKTAAKEHDEWFDKLQKENAERIAKIKAESGAGTAGKPPQAPATEIAETGAAVDGLTGKLGRLAVVAGGVSAIGTLFSAGWRAWLNDHEDVKSSVSNLYDEVSKLTTLSLSSWFESFVGGGDGVKSFVDQLTRDLGGQTTAFKTATGGLAGYKNAEELAQEEADKFTESLKRQHAELKRVNDVLEDGLALFRERLKTEESEAEFAAQDKTDSIDSGPGTDAEKAQMKKSVADDLLRKKFDIREKERQADGDVEAAKAKGASDAAKKGADALAAQNERVRLAKERSRAQQEDDAIQARGITEPSLLEERAENIPFFQSGAQIRGRLDAAKKAAQGVGSVDEEQGKLEQLRKEAQKTADDASKAKADAESKANIRAEQAHRDERKTQRSLGEMTPGIGPLNTDDPIPAPQEPDAPPAEAADPRAEAVNKIEASLREASGRASDAAKKTTIDELLASLNDADGATDADLKRVADVMSSMMGKRQAGIAEFAQGVEQFAAWMSAELGSMRGSLQRLEALKKNQASNP